MATRIKDIDGQREIFVEGNGRTVFVWSRDREMEFDRALIIHALRHELAGKPTRTQ